jgi:sigma-B regulation protein RsbU (phosphoserine phosphatase)
MTQPLLPELQSRFRGGLMITANRTRPRALIADDQPDVLESLRLLLKGAGYQTMTVTSPAAVLEAVEQQRFDLLLMDLNYARDTTSGQEGLDLLPRIQALDSALPIIVMTAWSSIDLAVEAMRRGARDFVQKPWENARLLATLRAQIEQGQRQRQHQRQLAEQAKEIEEAREIQQDLLPKDIMSLGGCEVFGVCHPASAVGGDYFDILKLSDHQLALCIADVVGKGMPAALLMANLQAAVKACASETMSPQNLCQHVNEVICANTAASKFITFFYAVVDTETKTLVYTNAGHNAPMLLRRDGSQLRFQEGGVVFGFIRDASYEQGEIELSTGDRLILFTDGLTELTNSTGEEFGEERLIKRLVEKRALGAVELHQWIMDAVAEFSGGQVQDDVTLVVMAVE